jgi:hypothetical protein
VGGVQLFAFSHFKPVAINPSALNPFAEHRVLLGRYG